MSDKTVGYNVHAELLAQQANVVLHALQEGLRETSLKLHTVTMRVKSPDALAQKMARPDRTYPDMWSVTDLIGLRVTTYFEDTIDDVARVIEKRFPVDFGHSVDKRRTQDSSSFGYRSLHYVCGLGSLRLSALPEHARFEIQVRSLLQHAWAEIEHDLGYKARDGVPADIRRRFARIAGLLEIADQEFLAVRRSLAEHAAAVAERIAEGASDLVLDRWSLQSLLALTEPTAIDAAIAERVGKPLDRDTFFPDYLLQMLSLAGITRVDQALAGLDQHGEHIIACVEPYFAFAAKEWKLSPRLYRGYGLFFLAHLTLLGSPQLGISKVERLAQFYQALDYPNDPKTAQRIAGALLSVFA